MTKKDIRDRREYYKQHRLTNWEKRKNYVLLKAYNLSFEEYNKMSEAQGHVCAICGQPETLTIRGKVATLSVDHCHHNNHVRQLLCNVCNTTLGKVKENIEVLQKMIDYLKHHNLN